MQKQKKRNMNSGIFFMLFLLAQNSISDQDLKTMDEQSDQYGGKTNKKPISKINQELEKHQFGTLGQWLQHSQLMTNSTLVMENSGMLKNRPTFSSRFKTQLEKIGATEGKRRKRSSSDPNHVCSLRISASEVVYECKPLLLWDDLIKVSSKTSQNDTEEKTLHKNSTKSTCNETFFEFNFRRDVTMVSDAVSRWKIPLKVTVLRLQYQNIGSLKSRPFYALEETLTSLRLDSNSISYISQSVFDGLHSLVELDLSHNRLSLDSLPKGVFNGLKKLKRLNLAFNHFKFVDETVFSCLRSLSYLDLSNNALNDINDNAFKQFKSSPSMVINLQHNRLKYPRRGWLILPRFSSSSSGACSENDQALQHDKRLNARETIKMRIIWGNKNPWQCTCNSSTTALAFLKTRIILQDLLNEENRQVCDEPETCALANQNLLPVRWEIDFPCSDLGLEAGQYGPGYPVLSATAIYDSCCPDNSSQITSSLNCQFMSDWIDENIPKNSSNGEQEGLTNNQVTIIGIIIVVLSPILLTLCPDCNKNVSDKNNNSSDSDGTEKEASNQSSFLLIKKLPKSSTEKT